MTKAKMNWPNALVALFKLLPKKKATEIRDAVFVEFAAFRAERDRLREALQNMVEQHSCGCLHPACKWCADIADARAALEGEKP